MTIETNFPSYIEARTALKDLIATRTGQDSSKIRLKVGDIELHAEIAGQPKRITGDRALAAECVKTYAGRGTPYHFEISPRAFERYSA